MVDGNYYDQGVCKLLLDIAQDDQTDDEKLDALGESVNREMDNFLNTIQITVPPSNITNDMKMAANYEVVSLYKAKKQDFEAAKYWNDKYGKMKESIKDSLTLDVENDSQMVGRF